MTKRHRAAQLAVVPLLAGVGLVGPAASAVAAPAPGAVKAATAGTELYVSRRDCKPAGDGSEAAPYCTIGAALAVVQPGQTVLVQSGDYSEKVTVTRSGTQSAPIKVRAVNTSRGIVRIGHYTLSGTPLTISGVHDVVVEGFTLAGRGDAVPVLVSGAQRITLDGIAANGVGGLPAVRVTGSSSDVVVSRGWFTGSGAGATGVAVEAGVSGATVTASTFSKSRVAVTDAPGARITGNTVVTDCATGIVVAGTSTGASIRNNILRTGAGPVPEPVACAEPTTAPAISVSAAASGDAEADHNLVDSASGSAVYRWGDTDHADLASFRAATGQGGHDILAPARLGEKRGTERGWFPLTAASPAVDSADATAPGTTRTDLLDNAHADSPDVPNTGTGNGYHDRGAVELQGGRTVSGSGVQSKPGGSSLDYTDPLTVTHAWPIDGPVGKVARRFSNDRYYRVGPIEPAVGQLLRAGAACVDNDVRFDNFRVVPPSVPVQLSGDCAVLGAMFTPVAPTRLLDTRAAVGIGTTVPVAANSEIVLPIMSINGVAASNITAVVLNVTVTQPTTPGFLTVYPDGTTAPQSSSVNFVAGETVPNLVTVPMSNGNLRIRNSAGGTVHVVADLQGFYSGFGDGFKPLPPTRVLDSRANGDTPIPANSYRVLDLSGRVPSGAKAVVLNVTVTQPTATGVLTAYPAGSSVPTASNLNFVAGQTIPNLVTVPVVNGRLVLQNLSSGTTHVLADLAGWYGTGATDGFVPYGPQRVLDTRSGFRGSKLAPFSSIDLLVPYLDPNGNDDTPKPTALVANLTVTAPTAGGVLTGHPRGEVPPAASNVNFLAGETASNAAVVRVGANGYVTLFNNSGGSTDVLVDQAGHFIATTP
ncbi:NosD domain-containing protein [Micromonospora sp. 067-2]|uniref:NosD domain-containing protein n=1 Tax=Micromonospora sp. 067-2 TaxID=2789270 RepID=UPI00397E3E42